MKRKKNFIPSINKSTLEYCTLSIDHHQLILLISLNQIEQPFNKLNDLVEVFEVPFGVRSIKPAFSNVYSDYQKVEKAYREALTVLSMKEKFHSEIKEINSYQNLAIYQLLDILLEKRMNDDYENHPLRNSLNTTKNITVIS
ncbi:hypothetical protein LAV79_24065 [Peribacillus butanolivorans]